MARKTFHPMLIMINKLLPSPSLASTLPPRQVPSLGPPGKRESSHLVWKCFMRAKNRRHGLQHLAKTPPPSSKTAQSPVGPEETLLTPWFFVLHINLPKSNKKTPPRKHKPTWFPQDSVDQLPFSAKDHRLDPSPTLPPLLKYIFSASFQLQLFHSVLCWFLKNPRGQKEFEWEEEDEKKEGKRRKKKNTKRLVLRSIS